MLSKLNKVIIFDLDGVLIDSITIHFEALNRALFTIDPSYVITPEEEKNIYEGLPTKSKLKLLNKHKGLPEETFDIVWQTKQDITSNIFSSVNKDFELIDLFIKIKNKNIKVAVASNGTKKTILQCLTRLGIIDLVDYIVSSDDVQNPKPHPEMYWKAMSYFGAICEDTVIFEDSIIGRLAAKDSGANLIEIENRKDLNKEKIDKAIGLLKSGTSIWSNQGINVLIPMAGNGSRFSEAGYKLPKPLIDVFGKPMIEAVVSNLNLNGKHTYIIQKDHELKHKVSNILNRITPGCNIVISDGVTEGAASTTLLAKEFINTDAPLIISNCDELLEWSNLDFLNFVSDKSIDGAIVTFHATGEKWSYVIHDKDGKISQVAEKQEISNVATVGLYYWKHGSDYVKYAERMIKNNVRVKNEFYVCPVYNEAIKDGKNIYNFGINKMHGLGTPEDLNNYLREKK
jgi:beta-phosphoglucomutase-like phosphatase (HAD superfamily)/dTDP-glucose pyrophosphorylase